MTVLNLPRLKRQPFLDIKELLSKAKDIVFVGEHQLDKERTDNPSF
jgi:hypothetical protein